MHFSKISLLAAAAALVSAQDLSQLPSCALTTALGDVEATGCALTDIKCICLAPGLFSELQTALDGQCSAADQAKALTVAQGLCATVGVCVSDAGVSYDGPCPSSAPSSSAAPPAAPAPSSSAAPPPPASSTVAPPAPSSSAPAPPPAYSNSTQPAVVTVYTTVYSCSTTSPAPAPPAQTSVKTTASASAPVVKVTATTVPFTGAAASNFAGAGLLSGALALAIAMLL